MKGNHNFKLFYYMHIVEILTNNGANLYKLNISKIRNTVVHTFCKFLNYCTGVYSNVCNACIPILVILILY